MIKIYKEYSAPEYIDQNIFEKYDSYYESKLDDIYIDWGRTLLDIDKEFLLKNAVEIQKYVSESFDNWVFNFISHNSDLYDIYRCKKCGSTNTFQFNCEEVIMEKVLG